MSQTPSPVNPPPATAGTDPSMEDILASIRRILSDDEQAAPGSPAASTATGGHDDVLPLSEDMLVPSAPPSTPAPMAAPPAASPPHAVAPAAPEPAAPERLVAPEAAAAAASSVSSLVRTLVQERETLAVHRGGPTIEEIVREEIRPLLKEWLDSNLPPLVERLVRAEIERVLGRVIP